MIKKQYYNYILSFFIPIFIFISVCALCRIVPFGTNTLLIVDMNGQYISFLSYLKSILAGDNDFFYSLSKTIGGEMYGFSAYYLFSPFNILVCLFKTEDLPTAVTLIVAIKIGLCGLTCCMFLRYWCKGIRDYLCWIFATSYALMSYNIIFCSNIMWLDGVYIFPIVLLGLEKIIRENSPAIYIFALTYALITNYYIGYMICIASVVFFAYSSIIKSKYNILTFIKSSLLAAGIAAVVLIPVFLSLKGTKASFDAEKLSLYANFKPLEFIQKFFTGAISFNELLTGLPNVYCGLLSTVLAILYFFSTSIDKKEKIASLLAVAFLAGCMYINPLNTVWHAFSYAACFYYRYSFVFSILMILLAYRLVQCESFKIRPIFFALIGITIVLLAFISKAYDAEFLSKQSVLCDCILVAFSLLLLWLAARNKKSNFNITAAILLSVIQLSTLFVNCMSLSKVVPDNLNSFKYSVQAISDTINEIKKEDPTCFRMEILNSTTKNSPMLFHYNGISHYSSTEKQSTKEYAKKMGAIYDNYSVYYAAGTSKSADSLLGIKYKISNGSIVNNNYALPLCFPADKDAIDCQTIDELNVFELQNYNYSKLSGSDVNVFTTATLSEEKLINCQVVSEREYNNYTAIEKDQPAYIEYQITCTNSDLLYLYIPAPFFDYCSLSINDEPDFGYLSTETWNIIPLGNFKSNEIITLRINITNNSLTIAQPLLYHESAETLESITSQIKASNGSFEKISSSQYSWKGKLNDNKSLIFTVPFENGWNITVDGKKIEPQKALDFFLAVELNEGEHEVQFKFIPPGLAFGACISVISILVYIFYIKK